MKICTPLSAALLLTLMSQTYANDYTAPRTEWGHPELRGVWNFSSSIPLQRPASLGDRAFYTVEEVQAQEQARIQREQAGIELNNLIGGTIGGYNDFWLETNPLAVPTERERLVLAQGLPVYRVRYQRHHGPVAAVTDPQATHNPCVATKA
jgi:hypothetical protein